MLKYLIPIVLILAFIGYSYVWAADSGAMLPTAAAIDASVGTTDWDTPSGALTDDGAGPDCNCRNSGGTTDDTVRLFVAGVPVGDDKATGATMSTGLKTYGGAADLWGATLSDDNINAVDFGVGISFVANGGTSKYLYLSDFDFAIPDGATIDGVEVNSDVVNPSGHAMVDYVSIKVYYTEAEPEAVAATGAIRTGSVRVRSGIVNVR